MLVEQVHNDQNGQLKAMLRKAKVSDALTMVVPLEEVARTHFPLEEGNRSQRNDSAKFAELLLEIRRLEEVESRNELESLFIWFLDNKKHKIEEIIRRLSRHSVLGHYFLEHLSEDDDKSLGYVCLLREVMTLPRSVAERIGKGLDRATYCKTCADDVFGLGLNIGTDDLSMPIVEIGSPTIEHILQSFSQLFARIGVADPVERVIGKIIDNCTADQRGPQQ